jgi:hypothetical protein
MLQQTLKISTITALLVSMASAYTPTQDVVMSGEEFSVEGTFSRYDFADAPDKYDWVFTASNGKSYQLLGTKATQNNVFGWKEVAINAPEAQWYMFQLGRDVDGDGSTKFDWVMVAANAQNQEAYKLAGVSVDGSFEYEPLEVNMNVNGNKISVQHQNAHVSVTTPVEPHNVIDEVVPHGYGSTTTTTAVPQVPDVSAMTPNPLTNEQKEDLVFMYNEEKLARDVYASLNEINPSYTLSNISTRSEQTHMNLVYDLVDKYDLDTQNLSSLEGNTFSLDEIQSLFDTLLSIGTPSAEASLQVGCMVEVTDINDLLKRMDEAEGVEDIEAVYDVLLSGSYKHYWAFDNALKTMGVTDGCCSAGDEYCKTAQEYPQESNGNGYGHRH